MTERSLTDEWEAQAGAWERWTRTQYLLRYRSRTLTGRQVGIAPAARPAVRVLDGYLQGDGVRKVTRETRTNTP